MLKQIAYTSFMFFQSGNVSKDSDEERAFIALNISMTTRMDKDMVDAALDISLVNISQPMEGNAVAHEWKWV